MDKKKILEQILPDLVELLSKTIDELDNKQKPKKAVKKKTATKKSVKKKPAKKAATKKKIATKKKPTLNNNAPREDFAAPNTYVDDLSEASELIETDKLITQKIKKKKVVVQEKKTKPKKCGFTTDENGNIVKIGGCGKEFEAYEGVGYLCDACITGMANAAR